MDNQSAPQVIAAIERLSNRIAKMDETAVESAAIANEARRAAMDAAEATNPKQIAAYVEKVVSPKLQQMTLDTRDVHKEILIGSWGATREANELRKTYESERRSLGRREGKLEELRKRYWLNAFCAAIFGSIAINLIFELINN